jgi:hypothetical protein
MNFTRNALLLILLLTAGCAAVVVGGAAAVGTYTYVSGQLKRTYNANLKQTYNAALAGCRSIGTPILDSELKLSSASIKTNDNGPDVWINLKVQSSSTTEVSVRVGYFGDEAASRRFHEALQSNL